MTIGIDYVGVSTPFYCTDGSGKILLHKRSTNCRDEQGTWDPGSGKLETGVTLEENVQRELEEEYGCKGEILEQLPAMSVHRTHNGKPTYWVAVPFIVKVDPKDVTNNEPEKIEEVGWFSLKSLPTPLHSGFQLGLNAYTLYLDKYFTHHDK